MVKPGAREQEFVKSLNHYLSKMNYGKSKPGELNEDEFVKFWADLYALFDKIDKNGGFFETARKILLIFSDGYINFFECCQYLLERKIIHQLS